MRPVVISLGLALILGACPDDEPRDFPPLDVYEIESGTDEQEDPGAESCDNHTDCQDDELCFEDRCVDRDEALDDCQSDDDCPDGFFCLEEDHCEEE